MSSLFHVWGFMTSAWDGKRGRYSHETQKHINLMESMPEVSTQYRQEKPGWDTILGLQSLPLLRLCLQSLPPLWWAFPMTWINNPAQKLQAVSKLYWPPMTLKFIPLSLVLLLKVLSPSFTPSAHAPWPLLISRLECCYNLLTRLPDLSAFHFAQCPLLRIKLTCSSVPRAMFLQRLPRENKTCACFKSQCQERMIRQVTGKVFAAHMNFTPPGSPLRSL